MVVQHRSLSSSTSYLPITSTDTALTNIDYDESNNPNSTIMANNSSSNNSNTTVAVIKQNYFAICSCLILYSIMAGYVAGIQPTNEFRYFSYHPLLMTCGMIGTMSVGTITKKMGGYMNTKVRCCCIQFCVHVRGFHAFLCRHKREKSIQKFIPSN